jgi:hypothetical protein
MKLAFYRVVKKKHKTFRVPPSEEKSSTEKVNGGT